MAHATPQPTENNSAKHGVLPTQIGAVLTSLVIIALLSLSITLGSSPVLFLLLILGGIAAASGVKLATSDTLHWHTLGITVLWVGSLLFSAAIVGLITQASGILTPILVGTAAFIAVFGIGSSTVQTYGRGAGKTVLRHYLIGTIILVSIATILFIGEVFSSEIVGSIVTYASDAAGIATGAESQIAQFVVAAIVYTLLLVIGFQLVWKSPIEVFVSPEKYTAVHGEGGLLQKINVFGPIFLGVYIVLFVLAIVLEETTFAIVSDTMLVFYSITTHPVLIGILTGVTLLLTTLYVLLLLSKRVDHIDGSAIAEMILPPTAFLTITGILWVLIGDIVTGLIADTGITDQVDPDGLVYQLVTLESIVLFLFIISGMLLFTSVVLSFPTGLAANTPGDQSMIGLATSVLGLVVVGAFSVFLGAPEWIVLGLILLGIIVWEVGEYGVVLTGELSPDGELTTVPGVWEVIALHGVSTGVIGAAAAAIGYVLLLFAGVITLSMATALLAISVCVVALIMVLWMLTG